MVVRKAKGPKEGTAAAVSALAATVAAEAEAAAVPAAAV
jgi:hypothetical protein